jgi:hypothetical protein
MRGVESLDQSRLDDVDNLPHINQRNGAIFLIKNKLTSTLDAMEQSH